MSRIQLSLNTFVVVLSLTAVGYAQPVTLRPKESVVDYLKSIGQPSDKESRKLLYETRFKGTSYTGSAQQNTRLLTRLVSENKEAKKLASESLKQVVESVAKERAEKAAVSDDFACPGWVPAAGIGVNGSYAFSTRFHIENRKLTDRDIVVLVSSAAASRGKMEVGGKVRLFVDGREKPFAEFDLQSAWFPTIGEPRTVAKYGKKGTSIELPENEKVVAEITLNPTVSTSRGTVALWGCTRRITITDGD